MSGGSRGTPKRKIGDISREHASLEEAEHTAKIIMQGVSPIAVAILGLSRVEQELEIILRRQFKRQDKKTWEKLTGSGGPLCTFWNKIEIAYAMKLIDETLRDHLHTIRKIRNAFAHAKKVIAFDDETITDELRSATLPKAKKSTRHKVIARVRKLTLSAQNAYVELCFIAEQELLKRRARGMAAGRRNAERRLRRMALPPNPGYLFGLPPQAISALLAESGTGSGLLWRPHQR